jgi:hypothetical protein
VPITARWDAQATGVPPVELKPIVHDSSDIFAADSQLEFEPA